jgi:hypothetical protein
MPALVRFVSPWRAWRGRRARRNLAKIYAASRRRYDRLRRSLGSQFQVEFATNYRRYCVQVEALRAGEQRRGDRLINLLSVPITAIFILSPLITVRHPSTPLVMSVLLTLLIAVAATVSAIGVASARGSRSILVVLSPCLIIGGIAAVFLALSATSAIRVHLNQQAHTYWQIALGATGASVGFLAFITTALGAAAFINWYDQLTRHRRCPELAAFSISQQLQEWVSGSESSFDEFTERRDHINQLEQLAHLFESGFGAALGFPVEAGSPLPFQLVAAHFRALRAWVALPQAQTRDNLRIEFGRTLNALASGQYHYLPRAERLVQVAKPKLSQRLGRLGRTLAIGGLPLLALGIVQVAGVQLGTEIRTTLLLGGVVWAAITWLTAIDPDSSARLSTTKDLLGVFTQRKE